MRGWPPPPRKSVVPLPRCAGEEKIQGSSANPTALGPQIAGLVQTTGTAAFQ